jgi:RNA polymerase sigma factor for flagellar operon FliA
MELVADRAAALVEDDLDHEEDLAMMRENLLAMPERERMVLTLSYYEELTLREIAEVLGVTESRVSQIRTQAVRKLRGRMELAGAA